MLIDRARVFILLLAMGLLAACGGGGSPGTPAPAVATLAVTVSGLPAGLAGQVRVTGPGNFSQTLTQTQTLASLTPGSYTLTAERIVNGALSYAPSPATQTLSLAAGAAAAATVTYSSAPLALALREVASVDGALFVSAPSGDPRLFILERPGRVRIVENGTLLAAPFLDISGRVNTQGEGGLLSIAFHPQYASNGYFFIYFTDLNNNIVVERHTVSALPNLASPGSGQLIIRIAHPGFTNHFGGLVEFGPDGYLYLGTGDGGGAGDPNGNARNGMSLLGKLLRLDVSNVTLLQPYTIPATNPYVNDSTRRPEIWASGLRNPWRFTFDGASLYIADVGQARREEVNIAPAATGGLDYGWNIMEGTLCYNASSCSQTGLTLPAFEYDHGTNDVNGCSITGGYVYRGSAIPELAGRYFYSDYCEGFLKSFLYTGTNVAEQVTWTVANVGNVPSFGRDGVGELYVVGAGGKVYRIEKAAAP